jgi:hypothetical protein
VSVARQGRGVVVIVHQKDGEVSKRGLTNSLARDLGRVLLAEADKADGVTGEKARKTIMRSSARGRRRCTALQTSS